MFLWIESARHEKHCSVILFLHLLIMAQEEPTQTNYVADATVPPTASNDSSRNSTGPLWALAGIVTGKYNGVVVVVVVVPYL